MRRDPPFLSHDLSVVSLTVLTHFAIQPSDVSLIHIEFSEIRPSSMSDFFHEVNSMRAWIMKKKSARTLIGLALTAGLISIGMLCSSRSLAQIVVIPQQAHCMPAVGNFGCDDCRAVFVPQFGCTASPPNPWSQAPWGCVQGGGPCTEWQNYSCGVEITCGDGRPTGFNCNQAFTLCQ